MRTYIPAEKTKEMWLYCTNCNFQKSGVYFNPPICPRCKQVLKTIRLTKEQHKAHGDELLEIGCKLFAKKYFKKGYFVKLV